MFPRTVASGSVRGLMTRFLLPFAFLIACTSAEEPADEPDPDTPGSLTLGFEIDADWYASMDEPASGPFWGSVFRSEDVTALGPDDGAESVAGVDVAWVDLEDGQPTEALITVDDIAPGYVVVLGFMDSDGNADPDAPGPDDDDPVTLPADNEFLIEPGQTTTGNVNFGLLNP